MAISQHCGHVVFLEYQPLGMIAIFQKFFSGAHGLNFWAIDMNLFLVTYIFKLLGEIHFGDLRAPQADNLGGRGIILIQILRVLKVNKMTTDKHKNKQAETELRLL